MTDPSKSFFPVPEPEVGIADHLAVYRGIEKASLSSDHRELDLRAHWKAIAVDPLADPAWKPVRVRLKPVKPPKPKVLKPKSEYKPKPDRPRKSN